MAGQKHDCKWMLMLLCLCWCCNGLWFKKHSQYNCKAETASYPWDTPGCPSNSRLYESSAVHTVSAVLATALKLLVVIFGSRLVTYTNMLFELHRLKTIIFVSWIVVSNQSLKYFINFYQTKGSKVSLDLDSNSRIGKHQNVVLDYFSKHTSHKIMPQWVSSFYATKHSNIAANDTQKTTMIDWNTQSETDCWLLYNHTFF